MTLPEEKVNAIFSETEWLERIELAACYRLADIFGFSDVIWNHITARIPGTDHFLIKCLGLRYDEVCASNLVTLDMNGDVVNRGGAKNDEDLNVTGFVIHSAIYAARADVNCVMHTHSPAGLAVSVLKDGLVPMVLDVMPLKDRVSYHECEGLSVDTNERQRLAKSLGENNAMIMRNHGLVSCGESVGAAFMLMYYLERACSVQLQVQASGQEYVLPPQEVYDQAASQYDLYPYGKYEWPALLRLVEQKSPGFRQ